MESVIGDIRCLVCHSAKLTPIAMLGVGQKQQVVRCSECRLEFVHPFATSSHSDSSAVTAEGYIAQMLNGYDTALPLLDRRASLRFAQYTRLLGTRPTRMLEIGSGPGWLVNTYIRQGIDVLGLELDEKLVTAAVAGAAVLQGDICRIDISTLGMFDVVYSSQTLEHILTPAVALQNMVAVLKPGGILHLDVPNGDSWGSRIRRIRHNSTVYGAISLPHHQIAYAPESLARLLEQYGTSIVTVREYPTNDECFGQTILPTTFRSRVFMAGTRILGHGYLLVALAKKL